MLPALLLLAAAHAASDADPAPVPAPPEAPAAPDAAAPEATTGAGLPPIVERRAPPLAVVRFLVMGDTGSPCPTPPANAAPGWDRSCLTGIARSALAVCGEPGPACSFGLLLGDNFYEDGVRGDDDPQWATTFYTPFAGFEDLPGFRFWAVPGNHDEILPGGLLAEVEHTGTDAPGLLWNMPPLPYAVDIAGPAANWLHIVGIDSTPLAEGRLGAALGLPHTADLLGLDAPGWRLLFAHHFLASSGFHGQQRNIQRRLRRTLGPLVGPDRAQVMIAGHDHLQQVLVRDHGGIDAIELIQGNSSKSRGVCDEPALGDFRSVWVRGQPGAACGNNSGGPDRETGFMVLEVTPTTLDVHAYGAERPDGGACEVHHSHFVRDDAGTLTMDPPESAAPGECLPG
jgi:hypothetical protein